MFANIEINARDLTGFDSEDILNMYLKLQQDERERICWEILFGL